MSDVIKKLTDLFGRTRPSAMAKMSLGLDKSPEVQQILNDMPKSNRQTGLEEKYRGDWNNQTNKEQPVEQLPKHPGEEKKQDNVEDDVELDEQGNSIPKKPNMFEKIQELVSPPTIFVSQVVKRHMERKAFDNPDPDADPQEGRDTRLLDPENPEYKRRKGFGKPFGDAYEGGELKCNVPAVMSYGVDKYARDKNEMTPAELEKIKKEFSKVKWAPKKDALVSEKYKKNFHSFTGTIATTKQTTTYQVVARSQDTFHEDVISYPFQLMLIRTVIENNASKPKEKTLLNPALTGNLAKRITLGFTEAEAMTSYMAEINIPMKGVAFTSLSPAELVEQKLQSCSDSSAPEKKMIHLQNAINYAGQDNALRQIVSNFIMSEFKDGEDNPWLQELFRFVSSAKILRPEQLESIVFSFYKKVGLAETDVLKMDFPQEILRKWLDDVIKNRSGNVNVEALVVQLDDLSLWKKVYSGTEWMKIVKKYAPERYELAQIGATFAEKMRRMPRIQQSKELVDAVKQITQHYKNKTPEWQAFQDKISKGRVSRKDLSEFLESIGVKAEAWTDIFPAKTVYDKSEVNSLFERLFKSLGDKVETELTQFYETKGKLAKQYAKVRKEREELFASSYKNHDKRFKDQPKLDKLQAQMNDIQRGCTMAEAERIKAMPSGEEKKRAMDAVNAKSMSDAELAYCELLDVVLNGEGFGVPVEKVRQLFSSLSAKYPELYPTKSIMGLLNKPSYTASEVELLVKDFMGFAEEIDKANEKPVKAPKKEEAPRPPKKWQEMTPAEQEEYKAFKARWEAEHQAPAQQQPQQPQTKKYKAPFAYGTDYKVYGNSNQFNIYLKFDPNFTPVPVEIMDKVNYNAHGEGYGCDAQGAICWARCFYISVENFTAWVVLELQSDVVTQWQKRLYPTPIQPLVKEPHPEYAMYRSTVQNYYNDWASALFREILRLAKERNVEVIYVRSAQATTIWTDHVKNSLNKVKSKELTEEQIETDLFYRTYYNAVEPFIEKDPDGRGRLRDKGDIRADLEEKFPAQEIKKEVQKQCSRALEQATDYMVVNVAQVPIEAFAFGTKGIRQFAFRMERGRLMLAEVVRRANTNADPLYWAKLIGNWIDNYMPRTIEEDVLGLPEPQLGHSGKSVQDLRAMVTDSWIQEKENGFFRDFWWSRSQFLIDRRLGDSLCPEDLQYDEEFIPAVVQGLQSLGYRVRLPKSFVKYWARKGKTFEPNLLPQEG